MAKSFSILRQQLFENKGLLDAFTLYGYAVEITKDLQVVVEGSDINAEAETLEEAREYAKEFIQNIELLEDIDTTIPQEKIAGFIKQYHNVDKITDTLIESYITLASSNVFTVDPVVTAIKESRTAEFVGKLQYTLGDGEIVAIDESTQEMLNSVLKDQPEIVEYMRESKNNFMRIIKELEE